MLSSGFVPLFIGLDYEFARAGAFYQNQLPKKNVEFTVVIRTYQRPEVLRFTLESLRNQTYPFFKVVVVEDGEVPQAESVVDEARAWLDTVSYTHLDVYKRQVHLCKCAVWYAFQRYDG